MEQLKEEMKEEVEKRIEKVMDPEVKKIGSFILGMALGFIILDEIISKNKK